MTRRKTTPGRVQSTGDTNARVVIVALGAAILAGLGFWTTEHDSWFSGAAALQATLNNISGLIIATGLLTAAWEVVGKRRFAAEVLEKAKLSADVVDAGLTRVTDQYLEEVAWADLFQGTTRLDIVVAYARTWRNAQMDKLRAIASTPGAHLRVFLPDPTHAETMRILADRFGTDEPSITSTVNEAVRDFSALGVGSGSVEVWVRQGDVVFSCYRFDSRAVLTLYSHSRERRSSVPTLVMNGGKLFKFVRDEIGAIEAQSTRVYP